MLRAMRRPYTAEYYERLVTSLAAAIPDVSIGTDLIAGFPGETDAQADALAALLERLPLSHIHVFPYSDRPGTEASRIPDKIEGPVIRACASRLRGIGERLSAVPRVAGRQGAPRARRRRRLISSHGQLPEVGPGPALGAQYVD